MQPNQETPKRIEKVEIEDDRESLELLKLSDALDDSMIWVYLSFASKKAHFGSLIIRAENEVEGVKKALKYRIVPKEFLEVEGVACHKIPRFEDLQNRMDDIKSEDEWEKFLENIGYKILSLQDLRTLGLQPHPITERIKQEATRTRMEVRLPMDYTALPTEESAQDLSSKEEE